MLRVAALIGFTETDLTGENTLKVYARYGIDLLAHSRLTFDDHRWKHQSVPACTRPLRADCVACPAPPLPARRARRCSITSPL